MRIVIAGMAKSGTTALFFRIKNSLSGRIVCCFEPKKYDNVRNPQVDHVLLKVLVEKFINPKSLKEFDKKIFITRDIRDQLVSDLLYSTYHFLYDKPIGHIKECFELLKKKESSPSSVPILTLFEHLLGMSADAVIKRVHFLFRASTGFLKNSHDFFMFRYEDLAADNIAPLASYLGFQLSTNDNVDPEFKRVQRTKGSGSWKSWFTPEDILFLRESANEYLEFFDYENEAWEPYHGQGIPPEHCSLYVQNVINERRAEKGYDLFP
ncbi:MAG: hypothetical protein ACE5FU_13910 [Nitrospinota bacterium]